MIKIWELLKTTKSRKLVTEANRSLLYVNEHFNKVEIANARQCLYKHIIALA